MQSDRNDDIECLRLAVITNNLPSTFWCITLAPTIIPYRAFSLNPWNTESVIAIVEVTVVCSKLKQRQTAVKVAAT